MLDLRFLFAELSPSSMGRSDKGCESGVISIIIDIGIITEQKSQVWGSAGRVWSFIRGVRGVRRE